MGSRHTSSPTHQRTPPAALLDEIRSESASDTGTPAEAIAYAINATERALKRWGDDPSVPARARSYFRAVMRRRIAKRHGGSLAAARLVADAVVADLLESGRDVQEAVEELERGWAVSLPPGLIAEYRERLCA